ncbi:hypothetical protein [Alkalibacillus haloalkaliphilus]|uniref:Uncharacterized protein n=1 Tax=Alkalibacillus haloalkaliphilus TaxID=94136 RepID=A0A511W2U9_9BACI|nr:hypothetical protein [Alkalibacillus haloalkaliphilus]GEN45406.1 hypothetical protein AHA02nite_11820 [Alkalibacillus haloalkaliphilus]
MLSVLARVKEKYKQSNKFLFALKAFFSALSIYFAIQVIFISTSGLVSADSSTEFPGLLLFGMFFCWGLTNVIELVEMLVAKKKEHFTFLLIATIFGFGVSFYILSLSI